MHQTPSVELGQHQPTSSQDCSEPGRAAQAWAAPPGRSVSKGNEPQPSSRARLSGLPQPPRLLAWSMRSQVSARDVLATSQLHAGSPPSRESQPIWGLKQPPTPSLAKADLSPKTKKQQTRLQPNKLCGPVLPSHRQQSLKRRWLLPSMEGCDATFGSRLQKPRELHLPLRPTFLFQHLPFAHAVPIPPRCRKEPTDAPHGSRHGTAALCRDTGKGRPPLPRETNPEGNCSEGSSGTSQPGPPLWAGTALPPLSVTSITEMLFPAG